MSWFDHILWITGCLSDRYLDGTCSSSCPFFCWWWKTGQGIFLNPFVTTFYFCCPEYKMVLASVNVRHNSCHLNYLFVFIMQVCVQGSMGEGALAGMPLQLAGTRKILEFMDWGDYGAKGTFINIGSIGIPMSCTLYGSVVAAFDLMPLVSTCCTPLDLRILNSILNLNI